jgi:hypothetical protein
MSALHRSKNFMLNKIEFKLFAPHNKSVSSQETGQKSTTRPEINFHSE